MDKIQQSNDVKYTTDKLQQLNGPKCTMDKSQQSNSPKLLWTKSSSQTLLKYGEKVHCQVRLNTRVNRSQAEQFTVNSRQRKQAHTNSTLHNKRISSVNLYKFIKIEIQSYEK